MPAVVVDNASEGLGFLKRKASWLCMSTPNPYSQPSFLTRAIPHIIKHVNVVALTGWLRCCVFQNHAFAGISGTIAVPCVNPLDCSRSSSRCRRAGPRAASGAPCVTNTPARAGAGHIAVWTRMSRITRAAEGLYFPFFFLKSISVCLGYRTLCSTIYFLLCVSFCVLFLPRSPESEPANLQL